MIALAIAPATAPGTSTPLRSCVLPFGPGGTIRRWFGAVHREDGEDVADPVDDRDVRRQVPRACASATGLGDDALDVRRRQRFLAREPRIERVGPVGGGLGRATGDPSPLPPPPLPPPPPPQERGAKRKS